MQSRHLYSFARALAVAVLMIAGGGGSAGYAAVISHWSLQEGALGTVATGPILDGSGNGHNGTVFGNPVYTSLPGGDTGLDFSNDHVRVTSTAAFVSPSLTVEAQIAIHAFGGLRQIVFRGNELGGRDPFYLAIFNNNLRWLITDSGGTIAFLDYDISGFLNKQIHVAGTIDNGTGNMGLYVNGSQVLSQNTAVRPVYPITTGSGCGISIGALHDCVNTAQHFDGLIGEVRISNMALTPTQFLGSPTVVPLPAALPLLAGGFGLLAAIGWIRKRKIAAVAA